MHVATEGIASRLCELEIKTSSLRD